MPLQLPVWPGGGIRRKQMVLFDNLAIMGVVAIELSVGVSRSQPENDRNA